MNYIPMHSLSLQDKDVAKYSRSGRLLKSKFEWDYSLNRALAFNVETELRVLAILEAQRDVSWRILYACIVSFKPL